MKINWNKKWQTTERITNKLTIGWGTQRTEGKGKLEEWNSWWNPSRVLIWLVNTIFSKSPTGTTICHAVLSRRFCIYGIHENQRAINRANKQFLLFAANDDNSINTPSKREAKLLPIPSFPSFPSYKLNDLQHANCELRIKNKKIKKSQIIELKIDLAGDKTFWMPIFHNFWIALFFAFSRTANRWTPHLYCSSNVQSAVCGF